VLFLPEFGNGLTAPKSSPPFKREEEKDFRQGLLKTLKDNPGIEEYIID
jgi:hypothetical protein